RASRRPRTGRTGLTPSATRSSPASPPESHADTWRRPPDRPRIEWTPARRDPVIGRKPLPFKEGAYVDLTIFSELESEVRSYIRSFPVIFDRARGSLIWDEEGNE